MKIGFLGLGIMGSRMASNLLTAGHELIVHNRSKEKATTLLENNAQWASSPQELGNRCDLIITMLAHPEAVSEMALGNNGFLYGMANTKTNISHPLWMDCSTVNPSFSKEMASEAKSYGVDFLDAPVAGTKQPAENGELVFLVGGSREKLDSVSRLLDVMGKKTIYMGAHGMGSAMKMLINQQLALNVQSFSESMALGKAMGIDMKLAMNVLTNTPVTAPVNAALQPKFLNENDEVNFPLKHMQKDLHLFSQTAYEYKVPVMTTNTVKEIYAQASRAGMANEDFSKIFDFIVS